METREQGIVYDPIVLSAAVRLVAHDTVSFSDDRVISNLDVGEALKSGVGDDLYCSPTSRKKRKRNLKQVNASRTGRKESRPLSVDSASFRCKGNNWDL